VFDIAWTEILLIAVIAILVGGPKELPGMLRAFGRTFGQVRRTAREFQNTFNEALRDAERQAKLDEVKKDLDEMRSIDPTKDVKKSLGETKSALDEKVSGKPSARPAKEETASRDDAPATGAGVPLTGQDRSATPAAQDGEGSGEAPRAAAGGERR